MLTEKELQIVLHYARWMARSQAFGLEWDKETNRLQVSQDPGRLWKNRLCLAVTSYLVAFSAWRLHSIFASSSSSALEPTHPPVPVAMVIVYAFLFVGMLICWLWHCTFAAKR